ncbi:hypothetical protein V2A60_003110 [Cordyceps javanica]|uniref:NUDIXdomain-containing protein n=1 Tax=Cordyceps javanica TaxID=43265 RepID=A0A545W1E3_9HYPO|nr:NUDIXdomain-containing protein [Cordyceps javanica]TQW07780.1 NUDIX domain-containing protein [Cordyceps javanica]
MAQESHHTAKPKASGKIDTTKWEQLWPQFGVSTFIPNADGLILAGRRKGSHGAGTWQIPSGKTELAEELSTCAEREPKEETNLTCHHVKTFAYTNDIFLDDKKHFLTCFALCKMEDPHAVPKVMEPEKAEDWAWWKLEDLWAGRVKGTRVRNSNDPTDKRDGELFLPLFNLFNQVGSLEELKEMLQLK